jgi:hypothetical protein
MVRKEILKTTQPATLAALRWILEVLPAAEIACGVRGYVTVVHPQREGPDVGSAYRCAAADDSNVHGPWLFGRVRAKMYC